MSGRRSQAARKLGSALEFTRLLWAIEHLLKRTSKLMHRRLGITGPQRLVLRIVEEQPGISPGEVARLIHLDKSTLTGVFRRLEERRLLVRGVDGDDRRRARLRLGSGSRTEFREVPTLESAIHTVFSGARTKDVRTAHDLLAAICARLDRQLGHAASRPARRSRRRR